MLTMFSCNMGFWKSFNLYIFNVQRNTVQAKVFQTPMLTGSLSRCAQT